MRPRKRWFCGQCEIRKLGAGLCDVSWKATDPQEICSVNPRHMVALWLALGREIKKRGYKMPAHREA